MIGVQLSKILIECCLLVLMMYALNREVEYFDMPQVREIVRKAKANNYTFASILTGVINSDAFRRQGPEAPKNTKVASSASNAATAATP